MEIRYGQKCPNWLLDNTYGGYPPVNIYGYWTSTPSYSYEQSNSYEACIVQGGSFTEFIPANSENGGIRPVITVPIASVLSEPE